VNSTIDAGWIPDLQVTSVLPSPWTGQLKFRVIDACPAQEPWLAQPCVDVTIAVGLRTVEIWAGGLRHGSVPRDELRTWFAHGTWAMPAGDAAWTARPMGVAIAIAGSAPWPVPADIATHLAGHL
jgi:hypothetical protein